MDRIGSKKYMMISLAMLFGYILFLCWLFPMHYDHEFIYAQEGNPWILQWNEFLKWHGRFLTHVPMRYTLQWGYPYVWFLKAFVIFMLYIVSLRSIESSILKSNKFSYFLLFSLFLVINTLFATTTFMQYYASDLVPLYTYYITAIFMIASLQYYLNIFIGKTNINVIGLCAVSFLAGASHEQAIVMIPMLVILYLFLKIKKISVPKWYWLFLPFFLLGFSIIMLSPGNKIRLSEYGNALNWEFMGEQINWLELGWKKYFYSLYRHIFVTLDPWYSGAGYLPSTWYIQLVILIFTLLNIKKYKSYLDNHVLFPLFYWMLSWGTCIVMAASPMYHSIPLEFSKFFLYISLTGAIYYYLKDSPKKVLVGISTFCMSVVLIGQGLWVKPTLKARKEYFELVDRIENEGIREIDSLPKAMLGNTLIIEFGNGLDIKYPDLKIKTKSKNK